MTVTSPKSRKQKILDYEIETNEKSDLSKITVFSRKQKILDYEIETIYSILDYRQVYKVENKRFSITRLKLPIGATCSLNPAHSRKQKILDYEIETLIHHQSYVHPRGQ